MMPDLQDSPLPLTRTLPAPIMIVEQLSKESILVLEYGVILDVYTKIDFLLQSYLISLKINSCKLTYLLPNLDSPCP